MMELIKILKEKAIEAGNKCNADMYVYFRGKIDTLTELESLFELESIKQTREVSKQLSNILYGRNIANDFDFEKGCPDPKPESIIRCTVRYRISFDRDVTDEELFEVIDNIIEEHGYDEKCDDFSVHIRAVSSRCAIVYIDIPKGCEPF